MDRQFYERVIKLVKELIPDWKCREFNYGMIIAVLLVLRTMMSIWLAEVNGRIVNAIVSRDLKLFVYRVSHSIDLIPIDFRTVLLRTSVLGRELGHRVLPKAAGFVFPKAADETFPQGILEEHALLQDLQP